jgi:hypothetical protein
VDAIRFDSRSEAFEAGYRLRDDQEMFAVFEVVSFAVDIDLR